MKQKPLPKRLDYFDITHDYLNLTFSRKMKETGKVSNKVRKKWDKRFVRVSGIRHKCDHAWAHHRKENKYDAFGWKCRKCRCFTFWLYRSEVPTQLAAAYPQYIKEDEDDSFTIPWEVSEAADALLRNPCLDC